MNPGGDFGKRELSPALRNRFTEIWVEAITGKQYLSSNDSKNDVLQMLLQLLQTVTDNQLINSELSLALFEFIKFYNLEICTKYGIEKRAITMRDIKGIVEFFKKSQNLNIADAFLHSVDMIAVESLSFSGISN
jgi:midasin